MSALALNPLRTERKMNLIEGEIALIKGKRKKITPEMIVDWARHHPASALYSKFEWDNTLAGELYRKEQARSIIKMIIIPATNIPQYVNIKIEDRGYEVRSEVLKMRPLDLVENVLMQLRQIRSRNADLTQLKKIWNAIDSFEQPSKRGGGVVTASSNLTAG